jgi:thiamine-phosphate pyrophosphorylase
MKRYYITDRKSAGGFRDLLAIIIDQLQLGVDFIQIREKDLAARALFDFTLAVLEVRNRELRKNPRATKILVNSRSDVAFAAGADGVHLPASAPHEALPGLIIGRSCHTIEEVKLAQADFVTLSPIFESPAKGAPLGLAMLREASAFGKPVFALGGVNWDNADECVLHGATGIAGIRLFQDPEL